MNGFLLRLRQHNRYNVALLLVISSFLGLLMIFGRMAFTGSGLFLFLVWNLFLAAIPYLISTCLLLYGKNMGRAMFLFTGLSWLLFFPNAPYILTDLFHLKYRGNSPLWYDLGLILFFAWTGLMLGYLSLIDMHRMIAARFNRLAGWMVAIVSLMLGSFGIYLGRFLRWNSWDIVADPGTLSGDILHRLLHPAQHPTTYGVTIVFSAFLIMGYLTIYFILLSAPNRENNINYV